MKQAGYNTGGVGKWGLSFLPGLTGKEGREHDYLYWDYGHVRPTFKQALRMGDYKMLISITDSVDYI